MEASAAVTPSSPAAGLPALYAIQDTVDLLRGSILDAIELQGKKVSPGQALIAGFAAHDLYEAERFLTVARVCTEPNSKDAYHLYDLNLRYQQQAAKHLKALGIIEPLSIKKVDELREMFPNGKKPRSKKAAKPAAPVAAVPASRKKPLNPIDAMLLGKLPEFGKSKKVSVEERRAALLERLGGKCKKCGKTEALEPDHIHGATWDVSSYSARERMDRYEEDERDGLLQALCRGCNASDGAKNRQGKARWKKKPK